MITITLTIDGQGIHSRCDATSDSPENERKYAAILLAATDAVSTAMESGEQSETVSELIRPTIEDRLREARVD